MRRLAFSRLSLRHKLPLWVGLLILATALAITGSNLALTRESIKKNMLVRSEILGRSLVRTLYAAITQDDVWRAYEIIDFPVTAEARHPSFQLENMVVLDGDYRVYVASDPRRYPMTTPVAALGEEFARLRQSLMKSEGRMVIQESEHILLAIPLVGEGVTLGTLVLLHPADYYRTNFNRVLYRSAWTTLAVLLFILPIAWLWGRRIAAPLTLLTERMGELGQKLPAPLPERIYAHDDELGRLFRVYGQMRQELEEKAALERQIVKSDRLAALGRLTAGIAHEINNPLGGLLTAVDTLKRHGQLDPVQARVVPLLERGLGQIQEIVAALLVEARAKSRPLSAQDIDDVHTLLAQEARQRNIDWKLDNGIDEPVELPATLIRQVLINLLLNAIQAAGENGRIEAGIHSHAGGITMEIGNTGTAIPPELVEHLFEPFTGNREEGLGMGLWITYQIVQQLHGHIEVDSRAGWTRFGVVLPPGGLT